MQQEAEGYVIRKGKAAVLVRMIEPAEHRLAIRQGYKTYHEDLSIVKSTAEKQKELPRGDYLEVTPSPNARRQHYLTVLYPFAVAGAGPKIGEARGEGWVGARVGGAFIGLRLNDSAGVSVFEGVQTDARLFCLAGRQ